MDKVVQDCVVTFHYELFDENGELMETSRGGEPVSILQGHGAVVSGLEAALEDRASGETFDVTVPPHAGYGARIEGMVERVSKKHLPNAKRLRPGMRTAIPSGHGMRHVTVIKVGAKMVDVDLNHPMAGRDLRFKVEILSLREAEAEEIAHGHVHGPGGHHH